MHNSHALIRWISVLFISLLLTNCGGGSSDGGTTAAGTTTTGGGEGATASEPIKLYDIIVNATPLAYDQYKLAPLNDNDFNALSQAQKYKVASKLYATFYYGTSYETLKESIDSDTFITRTREIFDQSNNSAEISSVEDKVETYDGEVMTSMLSRLYHLKPGKEYLNRWAAYILTQTILFSPAFELDTVYTVDALGVYNTLVRDFDDGLSLQWSTFKHMISDENWRRFRSPEDNGREMMEIFLMDFNDAHVPLAGNALKNWQLDRRSNTLIVTLNENTEPITNLFEGQTVTNGTDFYSAIVKDPNFLNTVSLRLAEIYFPNHTQAQKNSIATQLVSSNPTSWTDLLKQIVYSKEYLLNSTKTRSFEESFFPIAKTLQWHPDQRSFYNIYRKLDNMHQSTMRYKLGRKTEVPLDSQSFAWFHKTIREDIMLNYKNDADDDGWSPQILFDALDDSLDSTEKVAEYITRMLFAPIAGRDATAIEVQFFKDMFDPDKYNSETFRNFRWYRLVNNEDPEDDITHRRVFALVVLDYISRLNNTYEFK